MTQRVKVRYGKRPLSFSMSCSEQQTAPLMKFRQLKRLHFLQARTDSPHLKNLEPKKRISNTKALGGGKFQLYFMYLAL